MIKISSISDVFALKDGYIKESINIEYKLILGNDNDELAKDISSFSNSEGGIIIYGIKEENELPTEIVGIEKGNNRLRIEQVVNSLVSPPLEIRLDSFELPTGREVLVVTVPKSTNAPHMVSSKGRFYKRGNVCSPPVQMNQEEISLLYEKRNKIEELIKDEIIKKQSMLDAFHIDGWSAFEYIIICPTLSIHEITKLTKEKIVEIGNKYIIAQV